MGRPLKTAKAQAVVTITNTTATTNLVTTSANFTNLGIIAGMPFVVASNLGGLTAGTMYWILRVVNSGNNSTFTVSETPLNANPSYTAKTLTTASGTVSTTVAPVDAYFNNPTAGAGFPATNANTYSVVGGNTAIVGKQVLCNVAITQTGTGVLYANTANATVFGVGTDLANTFAANSYVQAVNVNGTVVDLGRVSTLTGQVTVAVANTVASGNVINTTGNAQTLQLDGPVRFTANLGGLVAGTTYFVKTIANATAFTVSTTQGGAPVNLSSATGTPDAQQDSVVLSANALSNVSGAAYYYATPEAGFIVRQKGKQKYLVKGATTGLVGQCYTANVANTAMLPNTMTITATYANSATVKVQSLSDHTAELFTATSGPIATGNIVIANASPAFVTFNTAAAADAANARPYPIVQIGNA